MQLFSQKINSKPVAEAFQLFPGSASATPEPLFKKAENIDSKWRESAFFKAIESDRKDLNLKMSNKYNLNFNNDEDIFEQTADSITQIKKGSRQNVKWEPIAKTLFDPVRWNSFETQKVTKVLSSPEIGLRMTSQGIRTFEQTGVSYKQSIIDKKNNDFANEIRITQTTRDTMFDSQIQTTDRNIEEPFSRQRFSNSNFSGSLLGSARGQDSFLSQRFNPSLASLPPAKEATEPPKLSKFSKKVVISPNQVKSDAISSNLVQLQSVKLNYKNEVFGIQSAIQAALKINVEQRNRVQKATPEKNLKIPKILKSEEKKLSANASSASNKGYSSFLGNWNKVNHITKNTSAQQDIRKSFEKLNLNNQEPFLKVPKQKVMNKTFKGNRPEKLFFCASPKIQQQKLLNENTLTRKNTADKYMQSSSIFGQTVRAVKGLKPKIGMSEKSNSNKGSVNKE